MKKLFLLAGLIVMMGCSSHAHLVKQQWFEVESDHFRVLTDAAPAQVEGLVQELERFRLATSHLLKLSLSDTEKLTIFALRDTVGYTAMVGPESARKTAGYFSDTLYGRYALLNLNGYWHLRAFHDSWPRQLLYHEYTHYLVARGSKFFSYPYWFEEGFAEFLSTAECDQAGTCLYGKIPVDRALTLARQSPLGLEKLLTATRADTPKAQALQVYASGWLLTHMLMSDSAGRQQLGDYLQAVHSGRDPLTACEDIFATPLHEFEQQYKAYGRDKMTGFSLEIQDGYGEITTRVRPAETAVALVELGKVLAVRGESEALQQLRQYAIKGGVDTRQLEYSVAFADLRKIAQGEGTAPRTVTDSTAAGLFAAGFDQSFAAGTSTDYWPTLVHAEILVQQAEQQPDHREEFLTEAYYAYKRVAERNADVAAVWFGLGHTAAHLQVPATTYQKYFWQAYTLSPHSKRAAVAFLDALQEAQMRDEFVRYGQLILPTLSDPEVRRRLAAAVTAAEKNTAFVLPPGLEG